MKQNGTTPPNPEADDDLDLFDDLDGPDGTQPVFDDEFGDLDALTDEWP
ncbi:hypothetical protein [Streptacidiphilus sp. MAP5-3]